MKATYKILIVFLLHLGVCSLPGYGVTQTINLHAGWNAIYLEVDPVDKDWSNILSGYPLESIYSWNPRVTEIDEVADPDQINGKIENLNDAYPKWLHFLPDNNELSFMKNLYRAEGGRTYLIKLGMTSDFELTIEGRPFLPEINWKADQFNLVGFHVDPDNPPTFREFFEQSDAHRHQMVYRLKTNGHWQPVDLADPSETTLMKSGEAFWIYSQGASSYIGSLKVAPEFGNRLDFGDHLHELTLDVANYGSEIATAEVSGVFSLYYRNEMQHWYSFDSPQTAAGINTDNQGQLIIGIKRHEMPSGQPKQEAALKITNNEMRIYVPLSVEEGPGTSGLWVGTVSINQVSSAISATQPLTPKNTSSSFDFRLILHMNQNSQTFLLKEVIQMWKKEVKDPQDPSVVLEPAEMVLMTNSFQPDDSYYGANLSNGEMVPARIDSAVFGFTGKKSMVGSINPGDVLTTEYQIPSTDPLNPFHHQTHPDHNTFLHHDDIYDITRKITIRLSDTASDQLTWGETSISGEYEEEIVGLFKVGDPLNGRIKVKGPFTLHRVSAISELLD